MQDKNKKHFNFFGLNITFKNDSSSQDISIESLVKNLEEKIHDEKIKNSSLTNEEVLALVLLKEAYNNKVLINTYDENLNELNKEAKDAFELLSSIKNSSVFKQSEIQSEIN